MLWITLAPEFHIFYSHTIIIIIIIIIIIVIIVIIINKGWQCKAGSERLTPYHSEDPSLTIPAHKMKEDKGKTVGHTKGESR